MCPHPSLERNDHDCSRFRSMKKIGVAAVLALAAWFGSGALGFPHVFQGMFVAYVALGLVVFLLLDAPPMIRLSGWAAVAALVGFYFVLSAVYIIGASAWPQYDPEVEKGKIEKILKRKREKVLAERGRVDTWLQQVQGLQDQSRTVAARLGRFAPVGEVVDTAQDQGGALTVVERGAEVYDLYECYNCHKIGGKGSVKKRGPILDNIGSLLTVNDIRQKIFDPTYLYAEGFEEQHKKGRMPDKYKDLMTEEEVLALATYLSTLKDPTAKTPKPVFVKANVEHGFTVFGYTRDPSGQGVAGVAVHAMPRVKGGHGASGKTNEAGYYEIFLHMHNDNAGSTVEVSAQGVTKTFVAEYDPDDHVTRRQQSLDFTVAAP